jgi:uncharacterized membrane protein
MVKRFIIYGILGWTMEIFWTGLGAFAVQDWNLPGFTYLWMFPIYGLAVFLEPVHDRISYLPWYIRGVIWGVLILCIEYVTGGILKILIGQCPWDYSGSTPYHIRGIIRLDYFPAWFMAGLIFERIHINLDRIRI